MRKFTVVVLDTGKSIDQIPICSYEIKEDNSNYLVEKNEAIDYIGHGTAIIDIIKKELSDDVDIICVKMFDNDYAIKEEKFIFSLEFIYSSISCDILHISSGICQCDNYKSLYNICKKIYDRGTIIVSAFDNTGAVSFPAAFPFVIGVDTTDSRLDKKEFEVVEGSIVNVRTTNSSFRVKWTTPPTAIVWGSSFSSVYITVKLVEYLRTGCSNKIDSIMSYLKDHSRKIYPNSVSAHNNELSPLIIKKAIIFPFNKEIHSLARFESMLEFKVVNFFDTKYGGKIGKSIKKVLNLKTDSDKQIKNIEELNWDDKFDTLILGHCEELSKLSHFDWMEWVVKKASEHSKQIYSFDNITKYCNNITIKYAYPKVDNKMCPINHFGKLYFVNKPVLAILGTSSKQGKYTLQLSLRQELQKIGYNVGQLGTEPSGQLFGFDKVYPMGYNSTVSISGFNAISLLNKWMWEISIENDPDIILVGGQSGTIPYSFTNLNQIPLNQLEFLLGIRPDSVVLCINAHDEIDYIKRTIYVIESLCECKVIALMLFPVKTVNKEHQFGFTNYIINSVEFQTIKRNVEMQIERPLFLLGDSNDLCDLTSLIIKYFQNE